MDNNLEIAAATRYPSHVFPVAECAHLREGFKAGVEWQKQQSYTEDQIKLAIIDYCDENGMDDEETKECADDFINNFLIKNKKASSTKLAGPRLSQLVL